MLAVLMIYLFSCTGQEKDPGTTIPRPNILFIPVDDLRPELGAYGHESIHTPHMDRLARQGVTFMRTYCQQAVCNPSRASLLTGLRPDSIQVWDLRTDFRGQVPDVITLPQYFKLNGYTSIGLGKTFQGGIFGISRAWINSGAAQVLSSQWNVDDAATAFMMQSFMHLVKMGENTMVAYQKAVLRTRAIFPDPVLWGSFNLFGYPQPQN